MALDFIKEHPVNVLTEAMTERLKQRSKLSKPKFYALLVGNLLVWIIVSGFYLDITPDIVATSCRELGRQKGLVVSGVVCNQKMQAAIIADQVYGVGDTVKGFTIIHISNAGVEFKKGEKTLFKEVASHH